MSLFHAGLDPLKYVLLAAMAVLAIGALAQGADTNPSPGMTVIEEPTHFSKVFQETKSYRIYLPPAYATSGKRYPVLYWFHGHFGSFKQNTYRKEFTDYVQTHDLIVVAVDGNNAVDRSTWDYSNAYEPGRYEGGRVDQKRDYAKYFPELVAEVDAKYRTIADRAHRFTSGQSRGGYMSPWVACQNKDLIGCAGMFCASPDSALVGDAGRKVYFPGSELYRAFNGLDVYCTSPIGDRYHHYSMEQAALNQAAGTFPFVLHQAYFPDHHACDIPQQLDYFLQQAKQAHPAPAPWFHATPYTDFSLWDNHFAIDRQIPALTVVEQASIDGMRLMSRTFVPDGPLVQDETIKVTTAPLYSKGGSFTLVDYNLTKGAFQASPLKAGADGRLEFSVPGGGHILGINAGNARPNLHLVVPLTPGAVAGGCREHLYLEAGRENTLDFDLVNVGTAPAANITVRVSSTYPWITFKQNTWTLNQLAPQAKARISKAFPLHVETAGYTDSGFVGNLTLEIMVDGKTVSTQNVMVYPIPVSHYLSDKAELAILDGRSATLPIYDNFYYITKSQNLQGGKGNGNGILEPGEQGILYVRLPQGLGPEDNNTFHPAYVLNPDDCPFIQVDALRANGKGAEMGMSDAVSLQSIITVKPTAKVGDVCDLWLKIESYYFSEEGFNSPIQRHRYDYRKVRLVIGQPGLVKVEEASLKPKPPTTRPTTRPGGRGRATTRPASAD